ncbi:hypothetical protein [Aureimonas sp. AU4]|uniref:hypothetical protein n=1 Tax=Aureimonas sp. AU4 TaxID=1638163 RepID=UPI0012E3E1F4|nr:hypothetical protein [Aureimonas sp. AU4]
MPEFVVPTLTFMLGVAAAIAKPAIVDLSQQWIARFMAKRRLHIWGNSRLGGDWFHTWYAQGSTEWPDENDCEVRLSVVGRHAAGFYTYQGEEWLVYLRLDEDRLVTGLWSSVAKNGYRGTLTGHLDLSGNTIVGYYLGNANRPSKTGVGEWVWWRKGHSKPDLTIPLIQLAKRDTSPEL